MQCERVQTAHKLPTFIYIFFQLWHISSKNWIYSNGLNEINKKRRPFCVEVEFFSQSLLSLSSHFFQSVCTLLGHKRLSINNMNSFSHRHATLFVALWVSVVWRELIELEKMNCMYRNGKSPTVLWQQNIAYIWTMSDELFEKGAQPNKPFGGYLKSITHKTDCLWFNSTLNAIDKHRIQCCKSAFCV